ncbi:MAG: PA2779 family protein [Betaproteobacteria bacterium]|nr:PA2779 family protein [Betaproteobacteria bacterium]
MSRFRRLVAGLLVVCIAGMGIPLRAQAGIVTTHSIAASAERDKVARMLERADVRAQLEAYGVKPADVRARVNALSDQEVAKLAGQIDSLPAGGDGLIGALVFIFLVLLVTDLLGLTKVFPFTRPVR